MAAINDTTTTQLLFEIASLLYDYEAIHDNSPDAISGCIVTVGGHSYEWDGEQMIKVGHYE